MFKKIQRVQLIIFLLVLVLTAFLPERVMGQVRPVYDYGALGLGQLLKRLNTTSSVMMIGAHPDDEDSALLAYLARGESARTAYLSLTRGDGGQNIIGPELFESLGVIRTEELLQARRLDGAEQFFTRAYDYGFSKTLDEAKQKWPEKVILCDVVRAIRTFRPLVVISRFSGTPADGHGHHQYAGYISPIAVKAAADRQQCTQAGAPWKVIKFYVEQGFSDNTQPPTLRLNTGKYDPMLGRSYFEIAMEGRSQHKSQGEGRLELHGDQFSGLNLVESGVARKEKEASVFDGIEISPVVSTIPNAVDVTLSTADRATLIGTASSNVLSTAELAIAAIGATAGLQVDALADRETVIAGENFGVGVKIYFHGASNARLKSIKWKSPTAWQIAKTDPPKENTQGFVRREVADYADYFIVKVPATAKATQPYWLESDRKGDLYTWTDDDKQALPFQPPTLIAILTVELDNAEVTFEQRVQFRFADPTRGEIRRELNIVPALSAALDQGTIIVPTTGKVEKRRVTMTVTNNSSGPAKGVASLTSRTPANVTISPVPSNFELKNRGEKAGLTFDLTIPADTKPGEYSIFANATVGENRFDQEMHTIAYPHIQTHRFYTRAQTKIVVLDLKTSPFTVGYVMGSGDEVPEAIRQMGLDLKMIDDLTTADLSKLDTIVVGIRASETRPDFVSNNQRLLDYVRKGGNLIVQYQRPSFIQQNLLPYPASMTDTQKTAAGTTSRVVDENAKVTILQPNHPIFNFPNRITDEDFEGWVQERNLYNFTSFDKSYIPLLESHDGGEAENKGGLVVASIGRGRYIYCSYSFFRQLPAGVPGAYRLFANLLSLPKAK